MKQSFSKYIGLIFCVAGAIIFFSSIWHGVSHLLFILIGGLWMIGGAHRFLRLRKLQQHNIGWYRLTYPGAVSGNGKVSCYACGNRSIHVRDLRRRTYTREHFCGDCGTTLFYSEEG